MLVAIFFAQLWGVIQLLVLGILGRTIRVRTAVAAFVTGLYFCAPAAVVLQAAWTRPAAWLTGTPLSEVVRIASFTLDPFIEEIVKVTPLALLLLLPTIKRQWSYTDCTIIGAATGSGFGLAEHLFRYGAAASQSIGIDDGWLLTTNLSTIVPSAAATMTSWLPSGAAYHDPFSSSSVWSTVHRLNLHLAWSAVGGLAVALIVLGHGIVGRRTGAAILLYIASDHAAFNAAISSSALVAVVVTWFDVVRHLLWVLPIAALAVAWWLDSRRQHVATSSELALSAEKTVSPRVLGVLRTAMARTPWSVAWVDSFVRLRRICASVRADAPQEFATLRAVVMDVRDRIDRALAHTDRFAFLPSQWTRANLLATLREPRVIAWLVLTAPAVLWFVVGGVPSTAWLQAALATRPGWVIVRLLALPGLVWIAWQIFLAVQLWPRMMRLPLGDVTAVFSLRLLSGAGALAFGGYVFVVSITTSSPYSSVVSNVHALDALASSLLIMSLLLVMMVLFIFPPFGWVLSADLAAQFAGAFGFAGVVLITASGEPVDPTAPTLPAPGPTWPAPPANPAPDVAPGEPYPYPGDPTNPTIPRPPRSPNIPDVPDYGTHPPILPPRKTP